MKRLKRPEFDLIIENSYEDIAESGIVIPSFEQMINFLDKTVSNKFEIVRNRIDVITDPYGTSALQHMPKEEWYQYLVDNHLFFRNKGKFINVPLKEVW
ncbi:hypothetical protein WQ57_05435 [Mesobacillus campisalis]|uniref:Uncharacterized protein n=1 Tax=Mesobacillus campisalis TaxID=1408103 RepID=A0A0M2T315_9BACI|nr:hypothetical protein [Mesobacillus campisalis]KKK39205.1 hypothetical protein WQ57_05435 [Mesobacillus campisalis]